MAARFSTPKMKSLSIEDAKHILQQHVQIKPQMHHVPLLQALGAKLAQGIVARETLPDFHRSTRDGFAVRAQDTQGARPDQPIYLAVDGAVWPGQNPRQGILPGQARRIATGAMLPQGADGVAMEEQVQLTRPGFVGITAPVQPGQFILHAGEEARDGEVLFGAGHVVRPQDLGLLAAAGVTQVQVYAPVQVGIISTGDELVPPDTKPAPGQVRDINAYTLQGQVLAAGGQGVYYGIVPDDRDILDDKLRLALNQCDMVLLSGGSSVGRKDMAAAALDALGRPGVLFHGLAVQPGRPTIGAVVGGKPVLGLPGQPVAAMVMFDLLGAPLMQAEGHQQQKNSFSLAVQLTADVSSALGLEEYLPVYIKEQDQGLTARPMPGKTGLIGVLARANGLAVLPAKTTLAPAGAWLRAKWL